MRPRSPSSLLPRPGRPKLLARIVLLLTAVAVVAGLTVRPGLAGRPGRNDASPVADSYDGYDSKAAEQLRGDQCVAVDALRKGGPNLFSLAQGAIGLPPDQLRQKLNRDLYDTKTPLHQAFYADEDNSSQWQKKVLDQGNAWSNTVAGPRSARSPERSPMRSRLWMPPPGQVSASRTRGRACEPSMCPTRSSPASAPRHSRDYERPAPSQVSRPSPRPSHPGAGSNWAAPGVWAVTNEGGKSARALAYEEQITGVPNGFGYMIENTPNAMGRLKFDGFKNGNLLEAKGPGYSQIMQFRPKLVEDDFVNQAQKQVAAAPNTPIVWHVAEEDVFLKTRAVFAANDQLARIKVVYTPPTG